MFLCGKCLMTEKLKQAEENQILSKDEGTISRNAVMGESLDKHHQIMTTRVLKHVKRNGDNDLSNAISAKRKAAEDQLREADTQSAISIVQEDELRKANAQFQAIIIKLKKATSAKQRARAIENLVAVNEELTRLNNLVNKRQKLMNKGDKKKK